MVTNTILGVPYFNYGIMGPKPHSNYSGPYIRVCGEDLLSGAARCHVDGHLEPGLLFPTRLPESAQLHGRPCAGET